jgi:carbon monoxide dehydrogenase subunit G
VLIEDRQVINVQRSDLWDLLMEIPTVAECMPGVAEIRSEGPDEYKARMSVKVGAINLKFDAQLRVLERDREQWTAKMHVAGAERGVGGAVNAALTMMLVEAGTATELVVRIDAKILGRLAEFGQPVMRKKATAMTAEFAQRIGERVAPSDGLVVPSGGVNGRGVANGTRPTVVETQSHPSALSRLLQRLRSFWRRPTGTKNGRFGAKPPRLKD